MQRNCCHISLAFILKFLNFLQAFIGVSIILYSIWMLDQWNHHMPVPPRPPLAPTPDASSTSSSSSLSLFLNSDTTQSRVLSHDHRQLTTSTGPLDVMVSGFDDVSGFGFDFNSVELPAPWYYENSMTFLDGVEFALNLAFNLFKVNFIFLCMTFFIVIWSMFVATVFLLNFESIVANVFSKHPHFTLQLMFSHHPPTYTYC